MRVDLPAPLSPSRPTISFLLMVTRDILQRLDAPVELVDVVHADQLFAHRQATARCRWAMNEWSAIMPRMMPPMKML